MGIGVAAPLVVGIDPGLYAGEFGEPAEQGRAQPQAVTGNAYGGGPLVTPPAVVEHAGGRLHVVPQEFSIKFPVADGLDA